MVRACQSACRAARGVGHTRRVAERLRDAAPLDGVIAPYTCPRRFARTWERRWTQRARASADFIEVADHVLVRHTWRGLGRGPDANIATTMIFTLRRGKVIYQEYFWDHAEALKAVGLSE